MKKYTIFLFISILFFTGCTVDYNIYIKSDHTLDENIQISDSISNLEQTGYTIDDIVSSKIQSYSEDINENNYSLKQEKNNDTVTVSLISKNKTMDKFIKMPYFEKMFNGADINDDDNSFSFKTNGLYNQSGLFYDLSGVVDEGFVDKININIKFEDKVLDNNADIYDEKNNTYTWIINSETEEKSIYFMLKQSNKAVNKKQKNKSNTKIDITLFISLIGGLAIILLISLVGLSLNKKRNKI